MILFLENTPAIDNPGSTGEGEKSCPHWKSLELCKKMKCMQTVKRGGWGWVWCAQAPGMREVAAGSVCSAQCTVIRTQPAQADPAWSDAAPRGKHLPAPCQLHQGGGGGH